MNLLRSDLIKVELLKKLRREGEATINGLREKTGFVNFDSIHRSLLFLEQIGLVTLVPRPVARDGRNYTWVNLTDKGKEAADHLLGHQGRDMNRQR
ncbi:MAG TPA: hypothetical protein VM889_01330 [Candidatus Thermoplasmatota archaeon]|nr:hypothetical protein [Candidatus Thermoplasmatota archaeon]